jgi:hypothetical protein
MAGMTNRFYLEFEAMLAGIINTDTKRPHWNVRNLNVPVKISSKQGSQLLSTKTINNQVIYQTDTIPNLSILGLTLSNSVSGGQYQNTVSPGQLVTTIGGRYFVTLTNQLIKRIDQLWTAGTNVGGRFSQVILADTTYHCFLIYNPTTQVVDFGFDVSLTAANRPSGWAARRIGSIRRSNGAIETFNQYGFYFERGSA